MVPIAPKAEGRVLAGVEESESSLGSWVRHTDAELVLDLDLGVEGLTITLGDGPGDKVGRHLFRIGFHLRSSWIPFVKGATNGHVQRGYFRTAMAPTLIAAMWLLKRSSWSKVGQKGGLGST